MKTFAVRCMESSATGCHIHNYMPRVGRSREPVGRGLPHAGHPRRPLDGARVDRRRADRALACRGPVEHHADGGETMTIAKADSYASVAARERYVPRGLA